MQPDGRRMDERMDGWMAVGRGWVGGWPNEWIEGWVG